MLSLVFLGMEGTVVVPKHTIDPSALPIEIVVPIDSTRGIATIDLSTDVSNAWAWIDLSLSDPEGQPVFAAGREVDYYSGNDTDGFWSEGRPSTKIRFYPDQVGDYTLELDMPEGGRDETAGPAPIGAITLGVSNGGSSPLWTLLAAFAFAVMAGIPLAGRFLHHRARWHGTDWSD